MRFTSGGVYKHDCCTDMGMVVIKTQFGKPAYQKLRVLLVALPLSRDIHWGMHTVKVNRHHYPFWKRVA